MLSLKSTTESLLLELSMPKEIAKLISELPKTITDPMQWKRSNVDSYFEKYGWKRLGQGGFARAFSSPDKSYIIKIYSNDEMYDYWLSFMLKNQGNPYVPKIRGKPFKLKNGLGVVRMEFLKHMSRNEWLEFMQMKDDPTLWDDEFKKVMKFLEGFKAEEDLSQHNVMWRGNQAVVLDPIAEI